MAPRFVPLRDRIEFELDGETVEAERGEPLAFALWAADRVVLSRSPKLHRPRGPYCFRGGCDGCLARVDGEPNVMTCMVPCRGGERVETQNVLGSRKTDLLRVTDWFFPHGVDHHHLLAGVPAASFVMQKIARHIAGLGRLPDQPLAPHPGTVREVDVLVVGGGPAGLTVARDLAQQAPNLRVLLVDDGTELGGSQRARGGERPNTQGFDVVGHTTAAGVYEREVLLVGESSAIIAQPRALVLATGVHESIVPFPGNDLPGVISARAAALLANYGIAVGNEIALYGEGPYSGQLTERLKGHARFVRIPAGARVSAEGTGRITGIAVQAARASTAPRRSSAPPVHYEVDALVIEQLGAPSFELAEQAGASIRHDPEHGGYLPITDANGKATPWLWCAGELLGIGSDLSAVIQSAHAVAADILRAAPFDNHT